MKSIKIFFALVALAVIGATAAFAGDTVSVSSMKELVKLTKSNPSKLKNMETLTINCLMKNNDWKLVDSIVKKYRIGEITEISEIVELGIGIILNSAESKLVGWWSPSNIDFSDMGNNIFGGSTDKRTFWLKSFKSNSTQIGKWAFTACVALEQVILPDVITIDTSAFYTCLSLNSVYCPKLETLREECFRFCVSLEKISFPSVRAIENSVFKNCKELTDITFGSTVVIFSDEIGNAEELRKRGTLITIEGEEDKRENTIFMAWDKSLGNYSFTPNITLHLLNPAEYAKANGNEWRGYKWKNILNK